MFNSLGVVAQLVEHVPCTQEIGNLLPSRIKLMTYLKCIFVTSYDDADDNDDDDVWEFVSLYNCLMHA